MFTMFNFLGLVVPVAGLAYGAMLGLDRKRVPDTLGAVTTWNSGDTLRNS